MQLFHFSLKSDYTEQFSECRHETISRSSTALSVRSGYNPPCINMKYPSTLQVPVPSPFIPFWNVPMVVHIDWRSQWIRQNQMVCSIFSSKESLVLSRPSFSSSESGQHIVLEWGSTPLKATPVGIRGGCPVEFPAICCCSTTLLIFISFSLFPKPNMFQEKFLHKIASSSLPRSFLSRRVT